MTAPRLEFAGHGCTVRAAAPESHEAGVGAIPTPASHAISIRDQRENWYDSPSVRPRLFVHLLFDASAGSTEVLSSPTAK